MVWAIQKIKNNPGLKGEKAVVIEVKLEALESAFLNLDSRQGLNRLELFLESLESQGIQVNKSSFDEPSKLRCFLLSLLPDTIWLVQKNFKFKNRFDRSSLFNLSQKRGIIMDNFLLDKEKAMEIAKQLGLDVSFDNSVGGVKTTESETIQSFKDFFPELNYFKEITRYVTKREETLDELAKCIKVEVKVTRMPVISEISFSESSAFIVAA